MTTIQTLSNRDALRERVRRLGLQCFQHLESVVDCALASHCSALTPGCQEDFLPERLAHPGHVALMFLGAIL